MSTLLEQASLVLIPSGYKEDVVYSEIPTDGSGDLTFTRASDGTRINSAGLVEVVPWNLVQQSSTFNVSPWVAYGVTLTSGFTDFFGTNNAFRFQCSSSGVNYIYNAISSVIGQQYTHSFYVRSVSGTQSIRIDDAYQGGGLTATITTEWQRVSMTFVATGNNIGIQIWNNNSLNIDAYICFAQTNIGSTAKPYFPTTNRQDVPRLTYQNGGGGCPSLLLEKQSTNLYPYSEDLTQWSAIGTPIVTGNYAISPDGTQNADRVQFASGNALFISGTGSIGENTLSVWAKATNGGSANFRFFANGATTFSNNLTATDEWQRFTFTYTFSAVTAGIAWATTGASDVLFWGFQHEVSSYATSYIPTQGSSVTRLADACYKTGISSLIGQSEGVVFVDLVMVNDISSVNRVVSITETNWLSGGSIRVDIQSGSISVDIVNNNASIGSISASQTFTQNTRYKIAVAYKTNDCALYVNGVQLGVNTSIGTMPTCSQFYLNELGGGFGGPYEPTKFNQAVLFPTRLSNAQLASLTTL